MTKVKKVTKNALIDTIDYTLESVLFHPDEDNYGEHEFSCCALEEAWEILHPASKGYCYGEDVIAELMKQVEPELNGNQSDFCTDPVWSYPYEIRCKIQEDRATWLLFVKEAVKSGDVDVKKINDTIWEWY